MKIKKFRIKNYKSIIDSGDCYLTSDVTILAGKNESGKTSILEALRDFDTDITINTDIKPIKNENAVPEISITFKIKQSILQEIFDSIGLEKKISDDASIEIIKTFPTQFSISEQTKKEIGIFNNETQIKTKLSIKESLNEIGTIQKQYPEIAKAIPEFNPDNLLNFENLIIQFKNNVAISIQNIAADQKEKLSSKLEEIFNDISKLKDSKKEKKLIEELKQHIPHFIFFNSFDDVFPNKIPFSELDNNEWIKDLSTISDLDIDTIRGSSDRSKEKHKDDINITLNEDYKKFWTQDMSNLSISWDSNNLCFWIKEDRYPYEPKIRSKGRQWHLAFYIRVTARAKEDVSNIILIDEPGLFLHAQAQKDILQKLEDSAREVQLIFSTHSPYLLEPEKLHRIKLIHKTNENGTKITNKVHALADKETLAPILTAIGAGLNSGIANFEKTNNVLVEGISDFYYLNAFKKIFNKNEINFISGGGAGNTPVVGTILHGWGCKVLYLFDNDQGKKNGRKNLKRTWHMPENLILSVTDNAEEATEDIFHKSDFKKYVLKDEEIKYNQSNSKYLKENRLDKALLAKQFLESNGTIKKDKLHNHTAKKIEELFDKIENAFKTMEPK